MPRVPASIRNKNPGAMYPGKSSRKFGSTSYEVLRSKDGTHKIATFKTSIEGGAAQFDLLDRAYTGLTVKRAIQKWCGGFYLTTYIRVLEDKAGLSRNAILTKSILRDQTKAIALCKAMAFQEAGRDYPMSHEDWAKAHAMAFPGQVLVDSSPKKKEEEEVAEPVEMEEEDAFEPENSMPSPKPETRVEEALRNSGTLWGILVAAFMAVADFFSEGVKWLLEAASQFQALSAVKPLFSGLGANLEAVTLGVGVAALVYAASRRIRAAIEGKIG